MLRIEHAFIERPLGPDDTIRVGGLDERVLDLVHVSPEELQEIVEDQYLRDAVATVGRLNLLAWPGADRWLDAASDGGVIPALAHNTYIASRLFALDALADPDEPMRFMPMDTGDVPVLGVAAVNWRRGDFTVASGVPGVSVQRITDRMRRDAWMQIHADLAALEPFAASVERVDAGRVRTASAYLFGEIAQRAVVIDGLPGTLAALVRVPGARAVAGNPVSAWAWNVASALLTRTANASGEVLPPRPETPAGLVSPEEHDRGLSRDALRTGGKVLGFLGLLVGGAYAADWAAKSLGSTEPERSKSLGDGRRG